MDSVPKSKPVGATPNTDPVSKASEQLPSVFELMWQLVVEEYKRRGAEIPEFDRTIEGIIRLQDDV
jgi:hypothetical protein